MALSHYMGQWILNWNRGIPAPNAPTSVLLSLHTGDPLEDDNGNNEVSGGNYSRQALTFTSPTLYPNITSFSGSIVNNNAFTITSNAYWGTVTHAALRDQDGQLLATMQAENPKTIESGDSYSLSAGKILVNFNKSISSYLAEKILNWFRGVNMPTPPVSTDLALHTSDPLPDDSAASEIIGLGYSRKTITFEPPISVIGEGSKVSNSNGIILGPATSGWGSITHKSVRVSSSGTMLHSGDVDVIHNVSSGSTYVELINDLKIILY